MGTLLKINDDIDEAKLLVRAAFMAAGDGDVGADGCTALRTLLNLVEHQLEDLSDRLTVIRFAPGPEVASA
jgi:hypothetical protein